MPKITIKKLTQASASDAFNKVKAMLSDDKDLKKLDPSFACTFNDDALTGIANGKLFKAAMTVRSQSNGSEVEIVVDLPLALILAKSMVEKTLQKKLEVTLA